MNISHKTRAAMLDALYEAIGDQSIAPPQSLLWWFGVALSDALAPLHGEPQMIERWPDWPRPRPAETFTFEQRAWELSLE